MDEKLIFAFNTFFYDFLKNLKEFSGNLKNIINTEYPVIKNNTASNLKDFRNNSSDLNGKTLLQCVLEQNAIGFIDNENIQSFQIAKQITIKDILNTCESKDKDVVSSYVLIFLLLDTISNLNIDDDNEFLDKCLVYVRDMQQNKPVDLDNVLNDDLKTILHGLTKVFKEKNELPAFAKNTKIGSIANEISQEIDLTKLNINSPEELFNFNGDKNVLGEIVTQVGSKLQKKFETNEISHEELLGEALGMLGNFGKGGMDTSFLNDLMKNGGFAEAAKAMGKGSKMKVDTNKLSQLASRERLRKKYNEKYNNEKN